jgi:hypothetical protein
MKVEGLPMDKMVKWLARKDIFALAIVDVQPHTTEEVHVHLELDQMLRAGNSVYSVQLVRSIQSSEISGFQNCRPMFLKSFLEPNPNRPILLVWSIQLPILPKQMCSPITEAPIQANVHTTHHQATETHVTKKIS